MNKSIIKSLLLGIITSVLFACTSNFEDFNRPPYDVDDEEQSRDDYKFRSALLAIQSLVVPNSANLNQFNNCLLAGSYSGYLADSNDGWKQKFSTYNPEEHWIQAPFNDIIPVVYQNYVKIKNDINPNYHLISIATIGKVASFLQVTDTYGPIPYTQIGADAKLTAPYDSEETIYKTMITELDEAIGYLTEHITENFSPLADNVYEGKTENWVMFANSLKLRLAIRISNVAPELAKQTAESAVNHVVGVINNNNFNARYKTTENPYYIVMYTYNGGDSRISADITSYMNGYKDPRMERYFSQSAFTGKTSTGETIKNGFFGLRNGLNVPKGDYKKYSNMLVKVDDSMLWMNAAEVAFLRAEGALRGWSMGGSAESFYNQGIQLSFKEHGVTGAEQYMVDAKSTPAAYKDPQGDFSVAAPMSKITIKWNESDDKDVKLERIITQKWIANFPLVHEAWAEYRRTGYPRLMPVVDNRSGGTVKSERMARRLNYPQTEYKENLNNLSDAIDKYLIGPDNMGTDLWWAKKN